MGLASGAESEALRVLTLREGRVPSLAAPPVRGRTLGVRPAACGNRLGSGGYLGTWHIVGAQSIPVGFPSPRRPLGHGPGQGPGSS